jgi:hypothetical protein
LLKVIRRRNASLAACKKTTAAAAAAVDEIKHSHANGSFILKATEGGNKANLSCFM